MTDRMVLVTAAAGGTQGQTGRHVTEMLLAKGVPVRAFVRRLDERSDRLRALGAEPFVGDFLDIQSVQRALKDVSGIYFAYPVQDGLLDATAIMAVAAREEGIARLVDLVMLRSSPDAPTPRMRQNYLSEQVFEWAGIGAVHVRAAVFYENLRSLVRLDLANQGAIRLPWSRESTVIPLVAAEDVAHVATALLTSPAVPAGGAYPLIGTVLSLRDIIATFSRVLGRDIQYEEISDDEWRRDALARGYDPHAVEHLSHLWRSLRSASSQSGRFELTDTIEKLGGVRSKSFEEFVREERSAL